MYRTHILMAAAAGVAGVAAGGGAPTAAAATPGEVTTAVNAAAAPAVAATPAKPRAKRGEGAKRFNSEAEARTAKPTGENTAHVFSAKLGDKERWYLASHRATVMGAILADFGIKVRDHDVNERADSNPAETATGALDKLSDAERQAIFAKYMGAGNFSGAAGLPQQPPRNDTSAEFDGGKNGGGTATAPSRQTVAAGKTVAGKK